MYDFKYLKINNEQHDKIIIIQLKFLGYISGPPMYNEYNKYFTESKHKSKAGIGYILINIKTRNVIALLNKNAAEGSISSILIEYSKITIKELTE